MSILAILGVIISTAAMLIVLSGFSGLKSYSLEFISSISPELKISAAKGKTFEFTPEIKSFLEKENIKYGLSYEDKALISINENNRIVRVVGLDDGFPNKNIDSIMILTFASILITSNRLILIGIHLKNYCVKNHADR